MRLFSVISLLTFARVDRLSVSPTSCCQPERNSIVTEIRGQNLIFYVDATGVQTIGNKSRVMPLWVVGHVGHGSVQ